MENFIFQNPTKILFGQGMLDQLPGEIRAYGQRILMVYGQASIKATGLYDQIKGLLDSADLQVWELSGISANPRLDRVYEGIQICRDQAIDLILAVGGGSVIDTSKAISAGVFHEGDFWQDLYLDGQSIDKSLPLATVLTMPATGSEMNGISVLVEPQDKIKFSYNHPLLHPKFSILEPSLTMTLPREQVIYGAVDMMSHVFEQYFSPPDDDNLTDYLAEAILRNIRINLDRALEDLSDYQSRSNLVWCATMAYNGLLRNGKKGDFQAHRMEYALSGTFDIPHGAGMAILHPNLLFYIRKEAQAKLARCAVNVWDVPKDNKTEAELALACVKAIRDYFKAIGAPTRLADMEIPADRIEEVAAKVDLIRTGYRPLEYEDMLEILRLSI